MSQEVRIRKDASRVGALDQLCGLLRALRGDREWLVTIAQYNPKRSDEQNRALWGLAYRIVAERTGQEAEDWHEYFLGEWAGWEEYEMFGRKKIRPRRRSSKLTTAEFAEYFDFIQRRAAENGILIPDPDPMWRQTRSAA